MGSGLDDDGEETSSAIDMAAVGDKGIREMAKANRAGWRFHDSCGKNQVGKFNPEFKLQPTLSQSTRFHFTLWLICPGMPDESSTCLSKALYSGGIAAVVSGAMSLGCYHTALHFSPFFKNSMGVQARVALLVMPVFYTTWLNVESTMWRCMEQQKPKYTRITDSIDELHAKRL